MKLKIVKGKITDEKGNIIIPEIGNKEHIDLVNKYNKALESGIDIQSISASLNVDCNFICTCGEYISIDEYSIDVYVDNDGDVMSSSILHDIIGNKKTCSECKTVYRLCLNKNKKLCAEVWTDEKDRYYEDE